MLPTRRSTWFRTLAARADYLQLHNLLRARVHLWVVPRTAWCPLFMARFVLWRRWGVVVGLLVGPQEGAHVARAGQRLCDAEELASYFRQLCNPAAPLGSIWPAGDQPILVTGTTDPDLVQARAEVEAAEGLAQSLRLRSYRSTLSERTATEGWSRLAFNQDPLGTPECTLVRRAREALQAAGLPTADNPRALGAAGVPAVTFRALYAGSRF